MMYEEDQILMDKWAQEEKNKRQKLYESTKPKRSIEGSQAFGYVKETQNIGDLHKNTVQMTREQQKLVNQEREDDSLESHFEGMSDDHFTKALSKPDNK